MSLAVHSLNNTISFRTFYFKYIVFLAFEKGLCLIGLAHVSLDIS